MMDLSSDHKDYAYKNEISLSIGSDEDAQSTTSTPSTVTPPAIPTPSPRQNFGENDTKPLTKGSNMDSKKPEGIDNKAFDAAEKSPKPLSSFGNGHSNGLNDSGANNGANKNGQLSEKKLAGKTFCGTCSN